MSPFLKSFIIGSLLLNLLLAGIVLGNAGHYFVRQATGHTWEEIGAAFSTDTQAKFELTIAQAERDTNHLRHELSEGRKNVLKVMKTEPFDKNACVAQMQQVKQLRVQIMQRMMDAVALFAEQITPQERSTLADMLRYPPRPSREE